MLVQSINVKKGKTNMIYFPRNYPFVSSRSTNSEVTRKPDNTLKLIQNPIIWNLYNPLKGIQNLVPNGIQRQWPIGLTIPTQIYINSSNQQLIEKFQWHQSNLLLPLQQIGQVLPQDGPAVHPTNIARKNGRDNNQRQVSYHGLPNTNTSQYQRRADKRITDQIISIDKQK